MNQKAGTALPHAQSTSGVEHASGGDGSGGGGGGGSGGGVLGDGVHGGGGLNGGAIGGMVTIGLAQMYCPSPVRLKSTYLCAFK